MVGRSIPYASEQGINARLQGIKSLVSTISGKMKRLSLMDVTLCEPVHCALAIAEFAPCPRCEHSKRAVSHLIILHNPFLRGSKLKPAKRSSCGRKVASINDLARNDTTIRSSAASRPRWTCYQSGGPILEVNSCRDRDGCSLRPPTAPQHPGGRGSSRSPAARPRGSRFRPQRAQGEIYDASTRGA